MKIIVQRGAYTCCSCGWGLECEYLREIDITTRTYATMWCGNNHCVQQDLKLLVPIEFLECERVP